MKIIFLGYMSHQILNAKTLDKAIAKYIHLYNRHISSKSTGFLKSEADFKANHIRYHILRK
jgi:hypothetical protein